jgi:hypothetical protein
VVVIVLLQVADANYGSAVTATVTPCYLLTPLPTTLYQKWLLVPNLSDKTKIRKWPSILPLAGMMMSGLF